VGTSLEAELLLSIAVTVTSEQRVESVLQKTVQGLAAQPGVALTRIWLLPSIHLPSSWRRPPDAPVSTEQLHLVASSGTPINSPGEDWSFLQGRFSRMSFKVGKVGEVAATRSPILIKDAAAQNDWIVRPEWAKREGILSFAGYPLVFRDNLLGVIAVFSRKRLDDQEFAWLGLFANQAAVAIANTRAFEDLEQAGEKSRRSEACLAEGQRLGSTGTFSWKVATDEITWSEELYRIYELQIGVPITLELIRSRVHPEDLSLIEKMKMVDQARTGGNDFKWDWRLVMPDRSIKYLHAVAHPTRDHDGQLEYIAAVQDVTQQRHAQGALQEAFDEIQKSEAKLRRVIDTIPTLAWCNLADGTNEFLNKSWHEYTGLSPEESHGWGWQAAFHPEDLPALMEKWKEILVSGEPGEIEARLRRHDGAYRWFLIRAEPFRDEAGKIVRWYGTSTDIDDRKQAENRLRLGERELRQLIDHLPQFVLVLDQQGSLLQANKTMLDYNGYTLEEMTGTGSGDRHRRDLHPDDLERVQSERRAGLSRGVPFESEKRLLGKDGRYRWFLFRYKPVVNEDGDIVRWFATATDIEERKHTEERIRNENLALREQIDRDSMFEDIVGSSEALRKVLRQVAKVAPSDSTVLILGETGTGKELLARAIHKRSSRSERAFIGVNCAAIPPSLIASELFGHEKGAFTGATQRRLGRFESANGGTIFLDEVGDLPPEIQIALLRVLQEREIERVGSNRAIPVDVRVLAATNRDLDTLVAEGKFRQDLFYRLSVVPIQIPSLRERADDIPVLVDYFIGRFGKKCGKKFGTIDKRTAELFEAYQWPGNVRELQNVIERAVILSEGDIFSVDETWLKRQALQFAGPTVALNGALQRQEKEMIEAALAESGGRVSGPGGAATKLGLPRPTLEARIKRLGINKYRFKDQLSN
jgi:formate hydrogenlyase transcriptional activator